MAVSMTPDDVRVALAVARWSANRNMAEMRARSRAVMQAVARAYGATAILVLQMDGEHRALTLLAGWYDSAESEKPIASMENFTISVGENTWWQVLKDRGSLEDVPIAALGNRRCHVYPVRAQLDLLGALVLVEPSRAGGSLIEFVTIQVAGVMVRREIERLLNEYALDLEKRVTERTNDLNVAYETLKQTQAEMVQVEKLASVGQLAAGIAHEINNPLGFIKSNMRMLAEYNRRLVKLVRAAGCDEEEIREIEEEIRGMIDESSDGIGRVEEITGNLLGYTRIEEGEWTRASVNDLLDKSLRVLVNELKYRATVHREFGDVPPIQCMPSRLHQVFVNILMNAVNALDEHGDIWIATGVDDDRAMVRIADNGRGIDAEHRERIFDPFFTTRDVGKGTGLGLSIVWDIVRLHNGTITVDSTPGEGTAFTIGLPIRTMKISVEDVLRGQ